MSKNAQHILQQEANGASPTKYQMLRKYVLVVTSLRLIHAQSV